MTYPGAVAGVLRREGLHDPIFLGAGEDAWAFALSDTEAIRVFPHASKSFVSELVHLYDRLQGHSFSFRCPCIHEVRVHEGIVYTIEAEAARTADGGVLPGGRGGSPAAGPAELPGGAPRAWGGRDRRSRVRGSERLSGLAHGRDVEEFLRSALETSWRQVGSQLSEEDPDLRRIVSRLEVLIEGQMNWDRKSLVHGDAYPGNVLVDDDGEVATILDFGRYSLVGDPRLDVAIAIELTEMVGDFNPEDTEYLRGLTEEDPAAAAYRAWTAVVLASLYRGDSRIVRKCIRTLRETAGRL